MNKCLYTIGHSQLHIGVLVSRLLKHKITLLVDIRSKPYSMRCPQFNRSALAQKLTSRGIAYEWKGQNLGGLGENVGFDSNILWLAERARSEANVAIICSEAEYKKCHRHKVIEPALIKLGIKVFHIDKDGEVV